MGAQRIQASRLPRKVTNRGDGSWGSSRKKYPLKERQRTQWGGSGRQYGTGGERKSNQNYTADKAQTQGHDNAHRSQRQGNYIPAGGTGNGKDGNGGEEKENDKKKYTDTRVDHKSDSHEESETEDSYKFEITSQQLSQVTPGGGALKIKLSKKKPLKITARAPKEQSETIPMELSENGVPNELSPVYI